MIDDLDAKISEFSRLHRNNNVLKSITLSQEVRGDGGVRQNLRIAMTKSRTLDGATLYLDLLDVRDLKIEQPFMAWISLSNLVIAKAPPTGKFQQEIVVFDGEQEHVLVCSCNDLRVSVSEPS